MTKIERQRTLDRNASPLLLSVLPVTMNKTNFSPSCMRPFYNETISKQEAHKLKVFIIGLFNPSMSMFHGETILYKNL